MLSRICSGAQPTARLSEDRQSFGLDFSDSDDSAERRSAVFDAVDEDADEGDDAPQEKWIVLL